ncbi:benzoylformate decarboxylase [Actinoplanes sp. KI2]|uniref:benzoylformate decarboxylase n=1 Tax=Actinoplanes sp. KI2 TaxID=2983315 RepID=UPI0021D5CCA4|nr:benzoylformate decarboxylase [Actinoplanes sp. KI2]MCU7729837.1 benzoylformate decarboxylase [Actinoplanes sp. KI2]
MTTVRVAFFDVCRQAGMTTWFGNPGSTELRMLRDWPTDFRYVLALQEASAVGVAAGYAIGAGRAQLVSLHSAGGVGHALGAMFNAYRDRVPLVVIAGQQTRAMLPTRPFLSADEPAQFPRPYVKWSHQPETAAAVPVALAEAYRVAMLPPRGPVFLSIPEDDWDAPGEPVAVRDIRAGFVADPAALAEVAEALGAARAPAIVAGPGVDEDDAWAATVALAETVRAAVWAAPMPSRAAFPEDHPLFRGYLPPVRSSIAALLGGHDVVVVLGAPVFTYHVHTEGPFLAAGTTLFHLDCDPAAAARAAVGTSVLTTVRAGVSELARLVKPATDRAEPPARGRPVAPPPADPLQATAVLGALRTALPADAVLVEEAPSHKDALHELIPVTRPKGYVSTGSGALGWGLPVAVGRALAGERVVCVVGDGSALYCIQALWTAARQGVPLTVVVLNNAKYEAVAALGRRIGVPEVPGTDLAELDLTALARGFGVPARRVTRAADVEAALAEAITRNGPCLLDIAVGTTSTTLY